MKATATVLATFAITVPTAVVAAATVRAEEFDLCPSGLTGVVTEDTSCAFADNVRYSWYAQPGTIITAFSPVTGKTYTMQCTETNSDTWPHAKRCVGVNDSGHGLIVVIA